MALELVESPVRQNGLIVGEATIEDVAGGTQPASEKALDEYIGQTKIVNNLKIFLKAALRRSEALDHVFVVRSAGTWAKRVLAIILANELGASLKTVHAPSVEKVGRFGGDFDESGRRRRVFYRRNSSPEPADRRNSLSGDGRLSARFDDRTGNGGAFDKN